MAANNGKRKKTDRPFPLAQLLQLKGLSRCELSRRTGLSLQKLSDVARGRISPTWRTVLRICTAIDADLGDLRPRGGRVA